MRYGEYRDGSYRDGRSYGRQNYNSRRYNRNYGHYPEELIDEMKEQYMDYNEGRENYNRGDSYNGESEMIQAVEGIMKNIVEIVRELSNVDNPQVMNVIKKHVSRIMDM